MAIDLRKAELPDHLDTYEEGDPYYAWQAREGVKVIREYRFDDLRKVELGDWERKGGKGAVIVIPNPIMTNDLHLVEIAPAGKSEPEHHLYEEIVYVLSGQGTTHLWVNEHEKKIIEWQAGSLFTIPLNVWYQHFNGSGTEPTRYAAMTNLPPVLRMWRNNDFVFNNPFQFTDRYSGEESSYFSGDGKLFRMKSRAFSTIWKTNFVPNADTMPLWDYSARGAKGINTHFRLDGNVTRAHISEFPVGTYKKGHTHGSGPHLVILGGVGFSLLWWRNKPEEKVKVDWKAGSMVTIPFDDTFHQHFNTGPEPARYLAMMAPDGSPPANELGGNVSIKEGGQQVEYEDEDPEIHKIFEDELKKHGAECKMADFIPWCTAR